MDHFPLHFQTAEDAFQSVLQMARNTAPRKRSVSTFDKEKQSSEAIPGEIWRLTLHSEDQEEHQWCLLLEHREFPTGDAFRVAPVFTETVDATHKDAVLPQDVLGFKAAFALGTELILARQRLGRYVATLPVEWFEKLRSFDRFLQGDLRERPQVDAGMPSIDESDYRIDLRKKRFSSFSHPNVNLRQDLSSQPEASPPAPQKIIHAESLIIWIENIYENKSALAAAGGISQAKSYSEDYHIEGTALTLNMKAASDSDQLLFTVWDAHGNPASELDGNELVTPRGTTLGTLQRSGCRLELKPFVETGGQFALRDANGKFWTLRKK